ncbi:unnamed protein product [Calicophoron daubneyi]|uniref:Uncharacterized protein n=1 Tax=Calicophoron daubneyi TaxID=300641 RepID=A0AAV2TC95_CALDB
MTDIGKRILVLQFSCINLHRKAWRRFLLKLKAFRSLLNMMDEFSDHVNNIREVLDHAKLTAEGDESTSVPFYKIFRTLDNEVSFLEGLRRNKSTIQSIMIYIDRGLEPSLQNRLQDRQKNLKDLIRNMAKSRQENMLELDRMHRENLALQIDLSTSLENRGNSDNESAEDNEEGYRELQFKISQNEYGQLRRTLEAIENAATIFTSHRPALLEKGKAIEVDLQSVLNTPTDEETKLLHRAAIAHDKIKNETPPSFVSMTSCLWKTYDKHTEALKCKINLEQTVKKIHEEVSRYLEDAYEFEEALQDLTDHLSQ